MADIVKINEVAVGDIVKVSGIEVANIVGIGGQEWPSAPAPAAYCPDQGGVNDDFTGANGSQPVKRWTRQISSNPVPDVSAIINNELRYEMNTPVNDYFRGIYRNQHRAVFDINTDFEIQIDYNIEQIAGRANTDGPLVRLGWNRLQDPVGGLANYICVQNSHVGLVYNARTGYSNPNYFQSASMSGKLRLRFDYGIPPQATFWYDSGSGWVQLGQIQADHINITGAQAYIEFHTSGSIGNEGTMRATVDNFQVNEATIVDCDVLEDCSQFDSVDDDFTGTNGSPPDTDKWTFYTGLQGDDTVRADIQNNKLCWNRVEASPTFGGYQSKFGSLWRFYFANPFGPELDFQVDVSWTDITDDGRITLALENELTGSTNMMAVVLYQSGGSIYVKREPGGHNMQLDPVSIAQKSTKLRITANNPGGSWNSKLAVWNSQNDRWEWDGNIGPQTWTTLNPGLYYAALDHAIYPGSGSVVDGCFDNFQVNIGTITCPSGGGE